MPVPTNDTLFQGDHKGVTNDPNLFSLSDIAAAMGTDSLAISATTSKVISTAAASALDSAPVSTASSKATSAASQASIADSKAVSGSLNTSTVDSKAASGSVNTSIADSKATSVATALIIPAVNSLPGFLLPLTGASIRTANAKMADAWSLADFGAIGNGVADDTTAIQTALTAADGGVLMGVPGKTYKVSGQLVPPTNLVFDLNGATLKPTGSVDMFYKALQTASATATVTGATQGSVRVTLSSMVGFTVGSVVRFTTDYAVTMPYSWSRIQALDVAASQIVLDSPLQFTYAGTVTVSQQPLYGTMILENGYVDISAMVVAPTAVVNLGGYDTAIVRKLEFIGGAAGMNASALIVACVALIQDRYAIIEDCIAREINLATGACFGIQFGGVARISRIAVDGDCFGTICSGCDMDMQANIQYRGRLKNLNSGRSIRAVKSSSCRHSTYENIAATDCETVLEIFNCARVNAKNINGTNIGLKTYAGQTAVNYAATLGDAYMQHALFDGINLDNIGGHGIQTSGDSQGRIQISNVSIINAVGAPIILATSHTTVRGVIIENWNTGAVSGLAGIVSSATSTAAAITIDDVIAIHTDNTKAVMNLAAGPPSYNIQNVVSPTSNPLYDSVNGISLGSGNVFSDALAGSIRSGTVTRIGHTGNVVYFSVPNTKTFTFTTATYSKKFIIEDGSGGQAAEVFADQASSTITIGGNPSSLFTASSSPGGGLIGIFKSAGSDIVSVKNNTGSTALIGICVISGKVTFTTDPA